MNETQRHRVLVVDDEPDLLTLYELTLVREGYDVECAACLAEAWELLQAGAFHAVVTDMRLPDGTGLELLQACLEPRKTFCFVGSSGVGKSTLVNALMGRDTQETRGVSGTGEGRHTTTRRELFRLANGAWVVDTPGMRELGMAGGDEGLNAHFEDVRDLVARCRFSDCTHSGEPGCAVRQALEAGDLEEGRLQHYHKLRRENEHYNRSHAEKRQRDKAFSKHVKAVLKSKPR